MFQEKIVEKIKTHFMFNNFFSGKLWYFLENAEKYGGTRQATDDNLRGCMRIAC